MEFVKDVERYDSIRDRWEDLPKLNLGRFCLSSCVIEKTLYVLGGMIDHDQPTNSIEKLVNIDVLLPSSFSRW